MNGFERRKQKKIELILHAASALFFKYGFGKVSVQEIAEQAGVSPATIYNYFGTKEQLYADMMMNWLEEQFKQYDDILEGELPFVEKTKRIMLLEVRNLTALSEEFPHSPASEMDKLLGQMEEFSEHRIQPFFIRYVALGKQEGYISPDLDEELALFYFNMFKNELARQWKGSNSEGKMEQLMELFFYGLAGHSKR